jgi:hypothetical protein
MLKLTDFDTTGAMKMRSNEKRGSGGAGKNGASVTYELILVTNEYTERRAGRAESCGWTEGARLSRAAVR